MKVFLQSIQSRLVALIILAILPGLGILVLYSIYDRNVAIENALQKAVVTIDAITADQAKIIEDTEIFLTQLSKIPAVLIPDSPDCSSFLKDILKLNNSYINLGVPLSNGNLLCNATPLDKPVNVIDRPYIRRAIDSKAFSIGEYQIDRAAGVSSINFAYPVIHPKTDEVVGLTVAVVSLDWLKNHLSETYLPKNTVAYITDNNSNIIAHYPANPEEFNRFAGRDLTSAMAGDLEIFKETNIITSPDNHTRVFVSRLMASDGFDSAITLSIGIPFDKELAEINKQSFAILLLMIFFALMIITAATYGVRRSILIPLSALIRAAKNLELGKSDTHYPKHGASELVALQDQFSAMSRTRLNAEQQLKDSQVLLLESQRKLARHIENTPLGCISWDVNFYCTEWNKSAEDMFGYSAQEAIGKHAKALVLSEELYPEVQSLFNLLLKNVGGTYSVNENRTKNGASIICEWHNTAIESSSGSITGVASLVQDITERKEMEEKLTTAASVFSHAREGIIITDAAGFIIDINNTFEMITGYEKDEILGQKPDFLTAEQDAIEIYSQIISALKETGHWCGEHWSLRKNQQRYPQLLTISTIYDDKGDVKNYVGLFSDITLLKQHQTQLEHIAHYDVLTQLPNRTLLVDRLKQAIIQSKRHGQSVAVVFIDLDGFKDVNDANGHTIGDELLIELSLRMKEALRDGDTLSRFGGDEFVVVLVDLDEESDFEPIVDRLLTAASESIIVANNVLKVSASIGVTLYPRDKADEGQLIRHADQAMYIAKQSGKNCYHVFDTVSDDAIKTKRESIQEISLALKNREFLLYYQPKVNMRTGTVVGFEALIRWQHPTRGLLQPISFLPVIEDQTITIDIGEWVIDEALTQITRWKREGFDMPVSINIDAMHLQQQDFTVRLAHILDQHPTVDHSLLQLEVLETSAFGDIIGVSKIMKRCVELGVKFAIDDFGTGYSSLTYLRRLPADLIKIDQSFVRDMLEDTDDLAIVLGVVGLAASFNREVIAEGVETIAHGTALLQLGCELAQGYGIAKPMPADHVIEWSSHWVSAPEWLLVPSAHK